MFPAESKFATSGHGRAVRRAVDLDWLMAFRTHCEDPHVGTMARLMFETGMRLGTAVQAEKSWLDAKHNMVIAPRTKNGDAHSYMVTDDLMNEIVTLPAPKATKGPPRNPSRLFGFTFNSGVYRHWRKACESAGIDYVPLRQAGRHSFATEMITRNGIAVTNVAAVGGWKDKRTLLDRYAHADNAREAVESVFGRKPKLKIVGGTE